jgi:hypothetical protein
MKVSLSICIFLMMILGAQNLSGQEIEKLVPSLADLDGWKMTAEPQIFIGDNLFDLIDGGADLYLEYGFDRVISVHYADPSFNNIQVEIYEMVDGPSAYGIFSITQQAAEWSKQYGNLSAVKEEYISFWISKYYVILSWSSRQYLDEPLLAKLANLIEQKIPGDGDYPELLQSFQAMDPEKKVIFLKGNLALSNFYYFDYKDIFKIQEALACSLGSHNRIVIRYPDQQKALEILADARQSISNNKRFTDVAMAFQGFSCRDNKGNFILIRQIENYIAVLVALDSSVSLVPFMDEITQNIENSPR